MEHKQIKRIVLVVLLAVVVGIAAAAILNAVDMVVIVNHFVQKGCGNLFNGSGERSGTDVDLVRAADLGDPSVFPQREVTVGFWRGLNSDGRP